LLALLAIALGIALMAAVPLTLVVLAFARSTNFDLSGTLVILSATLGMMLLAVGAVLYD
jgi:hypothetical protein